LIYIIVSKSGFNFSLLLSFSFSFSFLKEPCLPIIKSQFKPRNFIFRNSHASTIYASLLRAWMPRVKFERERLELSDGDFIDLDWSKKSNRITQKNEIKKLIITVAGLEGKSNSLYSRAAIRFFNKKGWDAIGMNYRGCSGEPNRLLRGYHMGASDDLKATVEHAIRTHGYNEIVLLGYSLGGNLALKYIGEEGEGLAKEVVSCVTFSVPKDIQKSDERLNKWYNWHYLKWFMLPLNIKANRKKKRYPEALKSYKGFFMSGNFVYFDTHFTAPANGFKTVQDYWKASSCDPVLKNITIPTLVVSSLNDTFISENCYPIAAAKQNLNLYLEMPKYGGHCGYIRNAIEKSWWMEERALDFVEENFKSVCES
jgi:predicted alpha/beta-fold hydrolase